jgi:heme/copper-type cytochrome/quinol oxidase subunit 1
MWWLHTINPRIPILMIIPGFGIISHVISTFAGKPVFGYLGMVYAIASIPTAYMWWLHTINPRIPIEAIA